MDPWRRTGRRRRGTVGRGLRPRRGDLGHALYFAAGSYATNVFLLEAGLPFGLAALLNTLIDQRRTEH
ncbi:hypothetical protein ABZS83_07635 [Streptomyces sp. NPDC005426]|uniref:hypothetical protein n=1 Tax=Streptomyces sp. NPDC005426 TaxID=3155344 RepID=UPI0033AEE446